MKKVRVILATTACMVAAAGVYAKVAVTTWRYYVPLEINKLATSGQFCGITFSSCDETTTNRCTKIYTYDGLTNYNVIISKKALDASGNPTGACLDAFKP